MKRVNQRHLSMWGTRLLCLGLGVGLFGGGGLVWANEQDVIQLQNGMAVVRGVTAGNRSLAEMAGRDRRRKVCLGYAANEPDHRLTLTQPQPRLRIAVDSEGQDTTLLVLGPRGIDCNDNARRGHRDAAITAQDWPAGEYQIWVGSFELGDRINYQLRISNPNNGSNNSFNNGSNNGDSGRSGNGAGNG